MRSKKYPMEEITEAVFRASTNPEDCCVPPQKKYKFSEIFDRPAFAEKLAVWKITKGNNSRIRMDGRGNPSWGEII